jgi:hypothetical protein
MCKDKWNGLYSNYMKISNYYVRINHQIAFWNFIIKENNGDHLPGQFNKSFMMLFKHSNERGWTTHSSTWKMFKLRGLHATKWTWYEGLHVGKHANARP